MVVWKPQRFEDVNCNMWEKNIAVHVVRRGNACLLEMHLL